MGDAGVGMIGLGALGARLATRIVDAGFGLEIYDVSSGATIHFARERGCNIAASPAMMAENCEIIVTRLPHASAVREVIFGGQGIAAGMGAGGVVIEMSAIDPPATVALARQLRRQGIALVDAAPLGDAHRAAEGALGLMVGGEDDALARVMPVLRAMAGAGDIHHAGPPGAGVALRALDSLIAAGNLMIAAEALLLGKRIGLDPAAVLDIVNAAQGASRATAEDIPAEVLTRRFAAGTTLDTLVGDLEAAAAAARTARVPMPFSGLCRELYAAARAGLGAEEDRTAIVRWLEATMGTELAPAPVAPEEE